MSEMRCALLALALLGLACKSGQKPDEITTVIDVGDFAEPKLRGLQCHVSQIGYDMPFGETPDEVLKEPWFQEEAFLLARSTVGWPKGGETDLFTGLR